MQKRGLLTWLGSALMFGGAAVLSVFSYNLFHATQAQKHAKEWLNATTPLTVRPTVQPPIQAPVQPSVRPRIHPSVSRGDVLGELSIPRLNMSVMVFEGDDDGILKLGAGHIPGTALRPGTGNIGIAAHRDTFFHPLRGIQPNDLITLRTPAGAARFQVTETEIVRPSDVQVLDRADGRDLTLVTCYPFSFMGHAPRRFIVHARKIG